MLTKVKQLIDNYGLPQFKNRIKDTNDVNKYIKSYHPHSFILTNKQSKLPKMSPPKYTILGDEMKIILTGRETFDKPISTIGINKIILDLRNHIGGSLQDAISILQQIYGDTTLFKSCNKWYSLKNGERINERTSNELAFQGIILVLVSNKTASTGEIIALTFVGRKNSLVVGQPTAGYLSMNNYYEIDSKHILNLTISLFSDINDVEYTSEKIIPINYI